MGSSEPISKLKLPHYCIADLIRYIANSVGIIAIFLLYREFWCMLELFYVNSYI
jgi:hypothetical protein